MEVEAFSKKRERKKKIKEKHEIKRKTNCYSGLKAFSWQDERKSEKPLNSLFFFLSSQGAHTSKSQEESGKALMECLLFAI